MSAILKKSPINLNIKDSLRDRLNDLNDSRITEEKNEYNISNDIQKSINAENENGLISERRIETITDALFESEILSPFDNCYNTDKLIRSIFGIKIDSHKDCIFSLFNTLSDNKHKSKCSALKTKNDLYAYSLNPINDNIDLKVIVMGDDKEELFVLIEKRKRRQSRIYFFLIKSCDEHKSVFINEILNLSFFDHSKWSYYNKDFQKNKLICSILVKETIIENELLNIGAFNKTLHLISHFSSFLDCWVSPKIN